MSPRCDDLDPFFDGELGREAAAAFRDHLAACARCQRMLRGRMLEAAAVGTPELPGALEPPAAAPPPVSLAAGTGTGAAGAAGARPPAAPEVNAPDDRAAPPRRSARVRRWLWASGASGIAAAAALVWWIQVQPHQAATRAVDGDRSAVAAAGAPVAIALAEKRGVDVRFSARSFDAHRPRDVKRAARTAVESIRTEDVLALEQRGDLYGVAAARALEGSLVQAEAVLARLPETADTLSDRAALALLQTTGGARANAERALSLATRARRLPGGAAPRDALPQARWNEAVALEALQLTRAAAEAFAALAQGGGPGWAAEAAERAAALRESYESDAAARSSLVAATSRMATGGPPVDATRAATAPAAVRAALHVALATAATPARLDELAPLARELGLAAELDRLRASDLRRRAPLAAALAAALGALPPPGSPDSPSDDAMRALRAVRDRARAAGLTDIARAAAIAHDAPPDEQDARALEAPKPTDAWWRLAAAERRAYVVTYDLRRYTAVEEATRAIVPLCRAPEPREALWCSRLLRHVATSTFVIGRVDRAYELAAEAQQLARGAGDPIEEGRALSVMGQIAAHRVAEGIDASAVADAYLRESAMRSGKCRSWLIRLDLAGQVAADHHDFDTVARLLRETDELVAGKCPDVRINGEQLRLRLIERGTADRADQLARLERNLATLVKQYGESYQAPMRLYLNYLGARARVAVDPTPAHVDELRAVIAEAHRAPDERFAVAIRTDGTGLLAEQAARRGDGDAALGEIAARLGVELGAGCAVGISHDDRVTVVARGAGGPALAELRDVPVGQRVLPAGEVVSAAQRARLAGCASVEVLATGAYLGVPDLLGPEHRWSYRMSPRRATGPLRLERQLVVTDVESPAELGLPKLRRMRLPGAAVVDRSRATPAGVLAALADTELAVINAHGVTDANEPAAASIVLTPDARGSYALTAEQVRGARLRAAPVVILAACHAGRVQVSTQPWSLASSFLAAGARAVIAPTEQIDDDEANEVFASIAQRMREGRAPEQAVAEERAARPGVAWLASVVVFQ